MKIWNINENKKKCKSLIEKCSMDMQDNNTTATTNLHKKKEVDEKKTTNTNRIENFKMQ